MRDGKSFGRWLRKDFTFNHPTTRNEEKSLMSMTPLRDRKQQVLKPVQQLEKRAEIEKCKSLGEVICVVDRFIFDRDHDGDVGAIGPAIIKDRSFYRRNYDF